MIRTPLTHALRSAVPRAAATTSSLRAATAAGAGAARPAAVGTPRAFHVWQYSDDSGGRTEHAKAVPLPTGQVRSAASFVRVPAVC